MPGCKYFDMITITDHPSHNRWKLWLKLKARKFFYYFRARKYRELSAGSEVVNFQQTLNAYGSTVLFHWLNQRSPAARVVTIHELDRHQLESPQSNKTYNKADAIIVQQEAMREQLIGLGVDADRIELVQHGTDLPALDASRPREGIMFYCGHHPWRGKGLNAVLDAMVLLKKRLGAKSPKLKVHAYVSREDLATLKEMAACLGLENDVIWLNQISMPERFARVRLVAIVRASLYGQFRRASRGHRRRRGAAGHWHEARRNLRAHRRKRHLAGRRQRGRNRPAGGAAFGLRGALPRPFQAAAPARGRAIELGRCGR